MTGPTSSEVTTAAAADKESTATAAASSPQQQAQAQALPAAVEFEPPLACVRRILKNTLPASTNVGKDASAAFARSAGIFIMYLTACANDFARENRRQTITANDVLAAVKVSYTASFCLDRHGGILPVSVKLILVEVGRPSGRLSNISTTYHCLHLLIYFRLDFVVYLPSSNTLDA